MNTLTIILILYKIKEIYDIMYRLILFTYESRVMLNKI